MQNVCSQLSIILGWTNHPHCQSIRKKKQKTDASHQAACLDCLKPVLVVMNPKQYKACLPEMGLIRSNERKNSFWQGYENWHFLCLYFKFTSVFLLSFSCPKQSTHGFWFYMASVPPVTLDNQSILWLKFTFHMMLFELNIHLAFSSVKSYEVWNYMGLEVKIPERFFCFKDTIYTFPIHMYVQQKEIHTFIFKFELKHFQKKILYI